MSQRTEVFRLAPAEAPALRRALAEAGFTERPLDHAFFQARGEDVIVSFYRSGKLVVQGRAVEAFAARFLGGRVGTSNARAGSATPAEDPELPTISLGSDEAGKGDSFGGLTVAAVAVPDEALAAQLREAGVGDSKAIADRRIRVLAPWIREHCACEERVLSPAEYNARHAALGANVNRVLTELHVAALGSLQARVGLEVAVVDRFSPREPVRHALAPAHPELRVREMPRAERVLAVAAASILAREAFLEQIAALEQDWACTLPLGSGSPVAPALRRFLKTHGAQAVLQVAKVHFSNVRRIVEELPWS